jgi:hypothetical protein
LKSVYLYPIGFFLPILSLYSYTGSSLNLDGHLCTTFANAEVYEVSSYTYGVFYKIFPCSTEINIYCGFFIDYHFCTVFPVFYTSILDYYFHQDILLICSKLNIYGLDHMDMGLLDSKQIVLRHHIIDDVVRIYADYLYRLNKAPGELSNDDILYIVQSLQSNLFIKIRTFIVHYIYKSYS